MNIVCRDIGFSFTSRLLFKKVNFEVKANDHVWIHGKSGTGKSSFLKILCGLLLPQNGDVSIDGNNLSSLASDELRAFRLRRIGYLHQENILVGHWSILQNLALVCDSEDSISELLNKLGLSAISKDELVQNISGGEKQRVSLARLLLQKPDFAFIDEPTSHLDDENTSNLIALIKQYLSQSTVIVVSHDQRFGQSGFRKIDFSEIAK